VSRTEFINELHAGGLCDRWTTRAGGTARDGRGATMVLWVVVARGRSGVQKTLYPAAGGSSSGVYFIMRVATATEAFLELCLTRPTHTYPTVYGDRGRDGGKGLQTENVQYTYTQVSPRHGALCIIRKQRRYL